MLKFLYSVRYQTDLWLILSGLQIAGGGGAPRLVLITSMSGFVLQCTFCLSIFHLNLIFDRLKGKLTP